MSLENVSVITQSAIRIVGPAGTVVWFDPFALTDDEAAHDADYVLITHAHYDHLSPKDFARVAKPETAVVAPASMAVEAGELGGADTYLMAAGEALEFSGITVEAVPAYNVEPERLGMHPQSNGWLGYVVTLDGDSTRYYVTGDTDQNPDNEHVSCDVMLLPIGGTYTCDPQQAAVFVGSVHPSTAVPTHYGSIVGTYADLHAFAAAVDPSISVVPKLQR